ncbi:4Fe-4S binding protein [bacterium]|nr:4Fe-4S binding protein [bacterium]
MGNNIYRRLAKHLDRLPGGFPPTESGVELRILQRLFTHDEAELALHLTLIPEESRVVARRAKIILEEAERRLNEMAGKGLIYTIKPKGMHTLYMAAQYVIGIWEYHVNDLDPDFIRDMNEYLPSLIETWEKTPQLRTIPVGRSISAPMGVLSYEKAEDLVRAQKRFLVAPCICRREHKMIGQGCDKPEESCLVFGTGADYYRRNGLGRVIDLEETLDILKKADRAGLVLQPSNARRIINICCCCGCCCQVLKNLKRHPEPATIVSSPFIAAADADTCEGCGVCIDRCQMEALRMEDEKVVLDANRCIGCGLCVSTCPTGSLTLVRKPESEQKQVPGNMVEAAISLGRARGKLGPLSLAKMQLKSKLDRLLANKRPKG